MNLYVRGTTTQFLTINNLFYIRNKTVENEFVCEVDDNQFLPINNLFCIPDKAVGNEFVCEVDYHSISTNAQFILHPRQNCEK